MINVSKQLSRQRGNLHSLSFIRLDDGTHSLEVGVPYSSPAPDTWTGPYLTSDVTWLFDTRKLNRSVNLIMNDDSADHITRRKILESCEIDPNFILKGTIRNVSYTIFKITGKYKSYFVSIIESDSSISQISLDRNDGSKNIYNNIKNNIAGESR